MERCYIHIGVPKTGTTYLQQLCWENRGALRDAGVLYPAAGSRRGGHHDFAFLLADGYPDWATPQPRSLADLEADLAEELRPAAGSSVLLSSEDFYMFPRPEKLLALLERTGALENREPAVVVYLRRQDAAHESWYNQTIKALGYSHTIDESIETFRYLWDYDSNLARWSSVFGKNALDVRVYEQAQFQGGTLANDFFHVLQLRESNVSAPAERVNTGLNYDLLEMQRWINKLPMTVQEKRRFHKQMIELSHTTRGLGLFDEGAVLNGEQSAAIMASYARGNSEVAAQYFGRADLFFEKPAPAKPSQRTGITSEKLLYLLGWILTRDE